MIDLLSYDGKKMLDAPEYFKRFKRDDRKAESILKLFFHFDGILVFSKQ